MNALVADPPRNEFRFSIASLLCTTASLSILLTYVKLFEPTEFLKGLSIVAGVSLGSVLVGASFDRLAETALWSCLGATTAFLCAVGEPTTHGAFQYAWPIIGAMTAGSAVLLDKYSLACRMILGAAIGFFVLTAVSFLPTTLSASQAWAEIACGPVAGAIMVGVVWILETLRRWRCYSRSAIILALTVGVIGGNVLGRWIGWL